ncbi:MAG: Ig-like domain-containing protein [Anaerolineaceae bacterium]|jgi:DNA-directed RNA polymerase subunit RPC12/RpoP
MKKKLLWLGFLLIFPLVFAFSEVKAQEGSDLILKLRRNWGYGSGADIQGSMTLYLDGDLESVERVVYYIDDTVMADLTAAPFSFSFNTDSYPNGPREMRAEVSTNTDATISVGPIVYNFISAADAGQNTISIIGVIVVVTLIGMGISWLITSRQKGSGSVGGGMYGLAVCKQCGKTFPRSILGINIVAGKFERCPHCGKWQITRRASPWEVELADKKAHPEETAEVVTPKPEKDDLDDSRFVDM